MMSRKLNTITLLLDLRRVANNLGYPPIISEYEIYGNHSAKSFYRRFDSWDNALYTAGLNPDNKRDLNKDNRISTEDLIDELQMAALAINRPPTTTEMDKIGNYSSSAFISRFGSWNDALKAADLSEQEYPQYTKEELLESVLVLAKKLGHMPSTSEYNAQGLSTVETVRKYCGSWTEVTAAVRKRCPRF